MNTHDTIALKRKVHRDLIDSLRAHAPNHRVMHTNLVEILRNAAPLLPDQDFETMLTELEHEISGLGPLEPLLADDAVTEVMVNGNRGVYVERNTKLERIDLVLSAEDILHIAERVVAPLGLRLDRSSPIVDARLPDGSRFHAIVPPLAVDGPCISIRRFGALQLELAAFGVNSAASDFLQWAVQAGCNMLISGGTNTGKTTLLNTLSASIGADERVVTIEETAELHLDQPHVVRLESRPPNTEGAGAVSVRQLVRAALRMRPDRIVVGEVRGGEAHDMLQALNTGHDGSMCTLHANSAVDALSRLETLALMAQVDLPLAAVRAQIGSAIDLVVHLSRVHGERRVVEISQIEIQENKLCAIPLFRGLDLRMCGEFRGTGRRADVRPLLVSSHS